MWWQRRLREERSVCPGVCSSFHHLSIAQRESNPWRFCWAGPRLKGPHLGALGAGSDGQPLCCPSVVSCELWHCVDSSSRMAQQPQSMALLETTAEVRQSHQSFAGEDNSLLLDSCSKQHGHPGDSMARLPKQHGQSEACSWQLSGLAAHTWPLSSSQAFPDRHSLPSVSYGSRGTLWCH